MQNVQELLRTHKQIATVKMLQFERLRESQGENETIDYEEWSKWLDISLDEILDLKGYLEELDRFEICTSATREISLQGADRICVFSYLNTYGNVMCRVALHWDSERTRLFLINSIDRFIERYPKKDQLPTELQALKNILLEVALNYLENIVYICEDILSAGYDWELVKEISGLFSTENDFTTFKQNICA